MRGGCRVSLKDPECGFLFRTGAILIEKHRHFISDPLALEGNIVAGPFGEVDHLGVV